MMRAILLALAAFLPVSHGTQAGPDVDAVNGAIDRGVNYLVHMQQPDGSWGSHLPHLPGNSPGGESALVLAALVHSGVDLEHQAVQRGLAFVRRSQPQRYYGACTRLLMEQSLGMQADEDHMDACTELIVDGAGQGYWDYPGGQLDLSNTQYALLGLWLAHQGGLKSKGKIFEKVITTLMRFQMDDGGWAYFGPVNAGGPGQVAVTPEQRSSASMTTAAMATLLFAFDRVAEKKSLGKKYAEDVDASIERGMQWLEKHMSYSKNVHLDTANAQASNWFYYYVYNIERLGTIADTDTLGGKPWYESGAKELLRRQGSSGGWGTQNVPNPVDTAFALLFLNRATKSIRTGGGAEHKGGFLMAEDPDAVGVDLRIKLGVDSYAFIAQFGKELREEYGAGGRFGLHVDEVKYFVDGELYKKFDADVNKLPGSERFTCKLALEPGKHELQAVVVIAPAPAKGEPVGSERIEVQSPSFTFDVDWSSTEAQKLAMSEAGLSLALAKPPAIEVSSERDFINPNAAVGGISRYIGDRAVDGSLAYGWVAKRTDAEPWIRMTWKKGLKVQTIVLSGPRVMPRGGLVRINSGEFSAPKRVRIKLNGKESEHDLEDAPRQRIELPKVTSIKSLEITILETHRLDMEFAGTGFGEVELLGKLRGKRK